MAKIGSLNLQKIINYLLLFFLFLLPWQTRWIYAPASLNGGFWEFGSRSLFGTELLLLAIIILFLLKRLISKDWKIVTSPKKLLLAFWLGGAGQGLLAVWQFFSQQIIGNKWLGLSSHFPAQLGDFVVETGVAGAPGAAERWLRAYGAFGSPNVLGGFLAVCFVVGLVIYARLAADERTGAQNFTSPQRIGLTLGQLAIFSGLILSFSRGAWIAAGVGVVLSVIVGTPPRVIGRQLILPIILIIFFFITLRPLFAARLTGAGRLEQRSVSERVSQLNEFKQIFFKHPFFGVGPGNYTLALYKQNPNLQAWDYQPVHNSYLLMLAEIGIAGCFLTLLLFCFLFYLIWKNNKLFLSVIATILGAALFDHWLWSLYIGQMVWWTVLALGILSLDNKPLDVKIE